MVGINICYDSQHRLQVDKRCVAFVRFCDTLLALALRLVEEGVLPLAELIARLTLNPATILGLPGGKIEIGEVADLIIVDRESHWICSAENFISKGRNTAFEGWDFRGRVTHTLVDGNIVYLA